MTLVNTATGVRYVLKLVYTGATPELIQSFTTTTPAFEFDGGRARGHSPDDNADHQVSNRARSPRLRRGEI